MSAIKLIDPALFGERILEFYLEQGWQSLSKRDLELLMFLLLEQDGAIDQFSSNHAVARMLRVTPSKVAALRRDAYARWRPLSGLSSRQILKRILESALSEERMENAARYASERRKEDGFLALLVEHPDYREELEEAIKSQKAIPVYERNPDVILIHYEVLFKLAEKEGLLETDAKKIQAKLKKLFGSKTDLGGFLTRDVNKLTWNDARSALDLAGAEILKGALTAGVTAGLKALLKIAFPFLP